MRPILVLGMTRSGSSLTMQMLDAAGVPCLGEYPAYEPSETIIGFKWVNLLGCLQGRMAAKIIDYHIGKRPPVDLEALVIVTHRRSHIEQAKSLDKFLRANAPNLPPTGKRHMRRIAASFKSDDAKYYRQIERYLPNCKVEHLFFEDTIEAPMRTAQLICSLAGRGDSVDVAAVVRKRTHQCYPGLLELDLLAERTRGQSVAR